MTSTRRNYPPFSRTRGKEVTERGDVAGIEVLPLEPEHGDFNADLVLLGRDRLARSLSRQLHPSDRHRFL